MKAPSSVGGQEGVKGGGGREAAAVKKEATQVTSRVVSVFRGPGLACPLGRDR